MKHFIVSDDKKNSWKNIKKDRNNWSKRQKADTLQAKQQNSKLQEVDKQRHRDIA